MGTCQDTGQILVSRGENDDEQEPHQSARYHDIFLKPGVIWHRVETGAQSTNNVVSSWRGKPHQGVCHDCQCVCERQQEGTLAQE